MASPSRSPPRRRYSRSRSPARRDRGRYQSRSRSRSPSPRGSPSSRHRSQPDSRRRRPRERYEWGRREDRERLEQEEVEKRRRREEQEKQQPNFGLSGKLAAETNTVNGVELKYNEPPEAAKPTEKWRLYVFKGSQQIDLLHLHRQSAYLIGRERSIVDMPVDHPSCSKQHAVLQYRSVTEADSSGASRPCQVVKPFIIDLESTNGTFLNGEQIPSSRYVELRVKDVLRFGHSTREYVLLHSGAVDQ